MVIFTTFFEYIYIYETIQISFFKKTVREYSLYILFFNIIYMDLFYFFTQPHKNNRSIMFLFLIENFFTFEKSYF